MLNSRTFPDCWYGSSCVLESLGEGVRGGRGSLSVHTSAAPWRNSPLAEPAKQQQQLRGRRCTLQAMPSVQGGTVTAEMLSGLLWGNRTLSYCSLKRWLNSKLNLVAHWKPEWLMLELARDAETELCQGFQSMDISRYFQVSVLHCDCWALISHQPNSECKDAYFLGRGWSDNTL